MFAARNIRFRGFSQIPISLLAQLLGNLLEDLACLKLRGVALRFLASAGSDPAPIPNKRNLAEEIPLDHQAVEPGSRLPWLGATKDKVFPDR
jgi:hypothetical protein